MLLIWFFSYFVSVSFFPVKFVSYLRSTALCIPSTYEDQAVQKLFLKL